MVKTGMSAVSAENAQLNLKKEIPGWDFRQVVADADKAWNRELNKVNIETTDSASRRIFYTAMYHTMTAPSVFSDVNGQYRGVDGKVYDGNFTNYTTLSLWDTYRAAHPLMTMIHTDMLPDMASTFINIYRQQGQLPVWHLMGNETNCMVGNPGIPVLADMVLKGYVQDKEYAYEAMKQSALREDRGLGLLKKYGYLPYDKEKTKETVAKGLEYALADACVAKVARMLGKKQDAKYFEKRAKSYSKYFDKETGFMRGIGLTASSAPHLTHSLPSIVTTTTPRAMHGNTPGWCTRCTRTREALRQRTEVCYQARFALHRHRQHGRQCISRHLRTHRSVCPRQRA